MASLATVLTVLFLTFLDNTIVAVTLANIQSSLHSGIIELQWIINAYMLSFAALMLAGGTLGDLFGRKKILVGGVSFFCVGALIATLSPNATILTIGRIVMGVGAAGSEPATLSMIRQIYPDRKKRARAIGWWAAIGAVALACGPILGGVLVELWSWRAVFAFSVFFGLIALTCAIFFLPESSDPEGRHVDFPGLLLGTLALSTVSVGVIQGEAAGFATWWIDLLFAASFLSFIGFIIVERKSKDPVLRLEFFENSTFTGANIVAFATNFGIFAIFFFVSLYLEIMGGFSGFDIAIAFLSTAGAMILSARLSSRWVAKHGPRFLCGVGCWISAAGMFAVRAVLHPGVSTPAVAWSVAIAGIGFGMTVVSTNSSILSLVPPERSGMAASTVNTFRELGGVFGVSVLGAVMNARLTSVLTARLSQAGVSKDFIAIIVNAVTHGGGHLGKGGVAQGVPPAFQDLAKEAIRAAEAAFGSGLGIALLLTAALLILAGGLAIAMMRKPKELKAEHDPCSRKAA